MFGFGRKKLSTLKLIRNKRFWKDVDLIIWFVPFALVHLSCILIASTQRNLGISDWYQHLALAYIGSLIIFVGILIININIKKISNSFKL